jgi:hypothetical protein
MITWTMIPEPEGFYDFGDTHQAKIGDKIVASIRTGGWSRIIWIYDSNTGEKKEYWYEANKVLLEDIKKVVEQKING